MFRLKLAQNRIPVPDDYQLELLAVLRERRTIRAHRLEFIWGQATIIARYVRDYQGPSREFLWMLELGLRIHIVEMITLSAEEEIDRQLEEETWAAVN
ncbi:hypothetical protein N7455_007942 [Penicillium solitum]|uniref:uncharacterized protein n=1 Tax=Penicillium solitum TaxID=60172 RepID=UPI0032C3D857|nr:hypothetical protein N7455_007942 [Penicillium solitum]